MWSYVLTKQRKIIKEEVKLRKLERGTWEEPILIDTNLAKVSAKQMKLFLFNKGYFSNKVEYRIVYHKQKAKLFFDLKKGYCQIISQVIYQVDDKKLRMILDKDSGNRVLNAGDDYDGEKLSAERDRIVYLFRNNGYYDFSRYKVNMVADTISKKGFAKIEIVISNPRGPDESKQFTLSNIYCETDYLLGDSIAKDTTRMGGKIFIHKSENPISKVLPDFIFFKTGKFFNVVDYQNTLNRLNQLDNFKYIDIQPIPDTINSDSSHPRLNIFIRLSPKLIQSYKATVELNTTEKSKDLDNPYTRFYGLTTIFTHVNRNVLNRYRRLETDLRFAAEATFDENGRLHLFDSVSKSTIGFTNSLIFPQVFIPFIKVNDSYLKLASQTNFNYNLIYESSSRYKRTTFNTGWVYQIKLKDWWIIKQPVRFYFTPLEGSIIATPYKSKSLKEYIKNLNDPTIKNLYDNHILTDINGVMQVNDQPIGYVKKPTWFMRYTLEEGGAGSEFLTRLMGVSLLSNYERYQYVRTELDIRKYIPILKVTNLVGRFNFGCGIPLQKNNSSYLPYEKRFYSGGSNSIRSWHTRQLGPGAFVDTTAAQTQRFDHSGDIKLEANLEYRFPLYSYFNLALFSDAGNVWQWKDDGRRINGKYPGLDSLFLQTAVSLGLGLRIDVSFLVFRIDYAIKLKDPSYQKGEQWLNKENFSTPFTQFRYSNISLGIGYPF